jgi:multiple sugar transport system substrate-binding protein
MLAGNVAMTTNGQWNVGTAFPGSGIKYGVAPLPYMKEKLTINTSGAAVVFNTGNAQKTAAAMEFIKFMTDVESVWDTLVASGIWMPNKMKYYTEPALTSRWINNPNFPENYKVAVVDYTLSHARPAAWYYTPNTNEFNALLQSILGDVWTGARTAQQVISANIAALKRIHAQ